MTADPSHRAFRNLPVAQTAELHALLERIERVTLTDIDLLGQKAAAGRLLEESVVAAGLTSDTDWQALRVAILIRFSLTLSRLLPDYDPRDEWAMNEAQVRGLRACWMAGVAMLAETQLPRSVRSDLLRGWYGLAP
jgi:hypothetical protein